MRIQPAQLTPTSAASGVRRSDSAQRFSLGGTSETLRSAGTTATSGVGGIETLLALQGIEDASERRRRFARKGTSALDLLDELKAELLAATAGSETLARLQRALDSLAEKSGTPGLDSVLGEIGLRVAVELAKRTPRAA
jgi:hypothetical protein